MDQKTVCKLAPSPSWMAWHVYSVEEIIDAGSTHRLR